MSNLIATDQVRGGDWIKVDFDSHADRMTFFKEAEDMPAYAMMQMVDTTVPPPQSTFAAGAGVEAPKVVTARSTRRS